MMRDSRRRSPESSRRRRRDQRRDSRENLAFVPPQPMNMNMTMPSSSTYPDYPSQNQTPTATGTARTRGTEIPDRERDRDRNRGRDRDRNQEQEWRREQTTRQRAASDSSGSYSSSSAASSFVDISRYYPAQSRFGGIFGTFFKAPSERRVRRRRSGRVKQRRVLYFGNSSSSSVNSDMAYGTGYVPKGKSREFNKQRTTSGGYSAHETRDRDRRSTNEYERGTVTGSSRHGGSKKDKTDEEILALGRQLSDFARKQNEHDLRHSGKIKATGLVAAAAAVNEVRKKRRDAKTRGIATSRPHGDYSDSSDGSDWEDASDNEGGFSDAESALAYGSVVSHAIRPTRPSMAPAMTAAAGAAALGAGAVSMAGRSGTSSGPAESLPAVNARKSSVVDPRLFGPYNSLRGMINTPCGFGEGQPVADHQQFNRLRRVETEPIFKGPVKDGYSMPTSEAGRFDVEAGRDLPYRSRPAPIPLQQPSPKAPVSAKVYQAEKLEEESQKHARTRSDETGISAATKLTGMAAAAAAAVALASDRKSKRDSRRDERRKDRNDLQDIKEIDRETERRDRDRDSKRRDKDLESELSRKSKRDSTSSKYADERDHKRHSRHEEDDTPRKRRETEVDHYPEAESSRKSKRGDGDRDRDAKSEVSRSSRRDSRKFDDRDERRKDEKSGYDQTVDKYDATASHKAIDPFQFQVAESALGSSLVSAATAPARPMTPQVVTVDREPNFDDPPRLAQSDTRLSRKDSFEIERMVEEYQKGSRDHPEGSNSRRHDYEEREHEARNIYEEAKHSTAPVAAAAVASAIAVEMARSRDHHQDEYDDGSRDYSRSSRDPVQEEADRYYREKVTAERIAADEQRSRSASPDKSIINKYDGHDQTPSYDIVTPPDMEDKAAKQSRYDGPDADVRIDNKIYPKELHKFRTTDRAIDIFTSRDPSCERERPLLNLVYPTPVPSRQPTPSLPRDSSEVSERSTSTSKDKDKKKKKKNKSTSKDDSTEDYFAGPAASAVSSTAKSVTWGENSTKSFEIESPGSRSEADATRDNPESGDKSRPVLSQTSKWGVIAAAIAGSSSEPANEPEVQDSRSKKKKKNKKASSDVGVGYRDSSAIERDDLMDDAKSEPPIPGPKPVSPTAEKMPGGFADDIDFAATLAAGLQDTGFDPNIVIDDPTYRRRDSPPHTGDTNGDKWNGSSFTDAVSDLTSKQKGVSEPGFFSEPIDMTREDPTGPIDEWTEAPKKLSKKEKKKLEKETKRQSMDAFESLPAESSETPPFEDVPEPQLSKKEKKKLEKAKRQSMEITEPLVTESFDTPTFEDAPESQLTKKEQRKRDKEIKSEEKPLDRSLDEKDLPREENYKPREVEDAEWEDSSKKKSKKNRKSRDFDDDTSSKISRTDSFDNKSTIRVVDPDNEWDAPKKSKSKSKRDSVGSEIISRSAPGSEVGERESSSKRSSRSAPGSEVGERESSNKSSSKSKRRSGTDFDDYGDDPPDQKRDLWDDRDVSSVVSEARGDERRKERRSKRSSLYDDDDAKSVASAPGSSRKSKRSSLYEDEDAARSSVSLSGSPRRSKDKEADKGEKKSSGLFASIFKSGNKDVKDESKKLDKESFLDNADTLGAGVGLATAAAAIAASASRSYAAHASFEKDSDPFDDDKSQKSRELEDFDPEIVPRAIKPAIDPQYGDLLPLPPSEPGSPKTPPENLPALPDSRPDTPPEERTLKRDFLTHRRRRSTQDTPVKSPSTTAIPISLRLGQRHSGPPSSPGIYRSPPSGSPVTTPESSRRSARISWDSSREIKPLYLLEHSRQGSVEHVPQIDLPALPPSEPSEPPSRESPAPGYADLYTADDIADRGISFDNLADSGLRIDTTLASSMPINDIAGSQETTPKASTKPELPFEPVGDQTPEEMTAADGDPAPVDSMSKNRSSYLLNSAPSSTKSNRTVKSEGSMYSPPESTPTKHLAVESSLSDIPEDLTSADEHFSDAMEAHSDTFEEARDWFDDVPPFQPVPTEAITLEPAPEALRSAPVEEPEPVPSTPTEDAEPDEWKSMSAKDKKKAKKARKNKELALAGAAAVAPLLTEEPAKIEQAVDSSPPQDEFEQPKKGKKGKKNKNKSFSFEDDLGETSKAQPGSDNVIPRVDAAVLDTDMAKDLATVDPETDKFEIPVGVVADDTLVEKATESVDTAIQEPVKEVGEDATSEAVPEADTWEASSKKSKKKRKSKDASSWDIEPAPEVAPTDEFTDLSKDAPLEMAVEPTVAVETSTEREAGAGEPLDLNKDTLIESSTQPAPPIEANGAKDIPDTATPSAEQSTAADAEEMWAAPLSKKDKKKKKKKSLLVDELSPVGKELETVAPPHQEQFGEIKVETAAEPVAVPDVETVTPEDLFMPEQVPKPAEPEFAPVSSKGKKKKKKSQQIEEPFPVDKGLETSTPSEEQPPVETAIDGPATAEASATGESTPASQEPIEPVDAGEAEFAPVFKSKKKKKKGKQLDDVLPVESEPETLVTAEEPLSVEMTDDQPPAEEPSVVGETTVTAQEPIELTEAGEDDFAPVSKGKKKKNKNKNKNAQLDEPLSVDKEFDSSANPESQPTATESAFTEEPAIVEQPSVTEEPSITSQEATVADFEQVSKGKKKKKKSKQFDDSSPVDRELDISTTPEDQPTTILSDQVITTEPFSAEEPPSIEDAAWASQEPIEAADSEFAPVSSKGKKKKKKSLQLGDPFPLDSPLETPTMSDDLAETIKSEADVPADTEPLVTGAAPVHAATTEPTEDDFAPVMKGKKKKKDKRKSVQWEDSVPDSTPEIADASSASEALGDSKIPEELTHQKTEELQVEELTRSLDTVVSEPLFSQGDAPLEPTQDDATSVEATQLEEAPLQDVPVEDFWTETSSSKKKGKKNKKKNSQANVWDLLEDKTVEESSDPVTSSVDNVDSDKTQEEVVEAAPDAHDIPEDKPTETPQDAQAEDEWSTAATGKKSKKKKKNGSKSASISEAEPAPDDAMITEPISFGDEPLTEEPEAMQESEPFVEPERAAPVQMTIEDEWPQATGKKSKKKKRQSMTAEPTQEGQSPTEPPTEVSTPLEIVADATAPAADPEAEFEVPKKGKKSKKKKNSLPLGLAETDALAESDPWAEDTKPLVTQDKDIVMEASAIELDAPTADNETIHTANIDEQAPTEDKIIGTKSSDDQILPEVTEDLTVANANANAPETAPWDDVDFFTPAKLSKKDKKKKKKLAGWEEPAQESAPELTADLGTTETLAETSDEQPSTTETPVETSAVHTQEPEANSEDMWGGFSLKQSKKDKKKKKAKDEEPEQAYEAKQAPATGFTAERSQESSSRDNAEVTDTFVNYSEAALSVEPELSRDFGAANDVPAVGEQEESRKAEDDEWAVGLSKKDKKKKKKGKALEMEADVSSKATEEIPVSEESETTKVEEVGDVAWTDTMSKKDKKKKNKKAKQGSQYDDVPPETAPIQEVDMLYDADARPEAEKVDPLEPAITAQNTGDTEISDAAQRDVTLEPKQITADVQEETQEPKDVFMTDDQLPRDQPETAESSAPTITEDFPTPQDSSTQPSGDPDMPVVQEEPADDEWSTPASSKKGKKGKKSRKSQVESLSWDETTQSSFEQPTKDKSVHDGDKFSSVSAQPITDAMAESSPTDRGGEMSTGATEQIDLAEPPIQDFEMQDAPAAAPSFTDSSIPSTEHVPSQDRQENEATDNWESNPQRKLSKKDKKKNKQSIIVDESMNEPTEAVSRDTIPVEPVESLAAATDDSFETPIIAEDVTAEPEEWLPTKKSKKDKKKAAKAALGLTALATAVAATSADKPTPVSREEQDQPLIADEPFQLQGSSSWADEMDDFAPITQAEPEVMARGSPQEDDGFGFTVLKKSKKGKKGKSRDLSTDNYPTPEPTPASGPLLLEEAEGTMAPAADEGTIPTETVDAADESATPSKKKGKKGKKSKQNSGTMTPVDTISASEPIFPETTTETLESSLNPNPGLELAEGEFTSREIEAPAIEAPATVDIEDEWAMPSKKKGKKGKKNKTDSGTMTPVDPTPASELIIAEPMTETFESSVEPAPAPELAKGEFTSREIEPPAVIDFEDEWAVPSKKNGKKGKKNKMGSGTMTPTEQAPVETISESMEAITEPTSIETKQLETEAAEIEPLATVAVEDDEWAIPSKKTSKKGKKDKSGSGISTPVNESNSLADQQPETAPTISTEEVLHDVDPMADFARVDAQEAPKALDLEEPPQPVDNDDVEGWGFEVKKKGKKGKKSKAGSGSMTPITPLDASTELVKDEPWTTEEPATARDDNEPLTTSIHGTTEAPQPVNEEDEWAVPTKKKKGKGKKSKSIPLSVFDEPSATRSDTEAGPASEDYSSAMKVDTISVEREDRDFADIVPETRGFGHVPDAPAGDHDTSEATDINIAPGVHVKDVTDESAPVTAEANPDDTWAAPTKKTSKKEKKRKSSQVVILDSPREESFAHEEQDPFVAEAQPEEAANDEWPDDDFSVPKSKKKKGKKATESPAEPADKKATTPLTAVTTESSTGFMDDILGTDAGAGDHDHHIEESAFSKGLGESVKDDKNNAKSGPSTTETLAAASAVTGGVALLAEKFGGGKKKKAKGKQKKILDKRQPQEDDMFDDPALWEGADKKGLDDGKDAELHDDFWGGAADEEAKYEEKEEHMGEEALGVTSTGDMKDAPTTTRGNFTESGGGWKEKAYQGVPLDDEFGESPVLGRGEAAPTLSTEHAGLLRRSTEVGSPVGGLLKERSEPQQTLRSMDSESDFRRSPTRGLPAVQEVPEAEAIAAQYNWPTPEMNRDSGFAPESPNPQQRRSLTFQDEAQRDSGVHTDDYKDATVHTPDVSAERRLRRSPFATPVLREPETTIATPEPEKKRSRKATKDYGDVAAMGGAAAAAGLAAKSATTKDNDTPGRRSVSDSPYNYASSGASGPSRPSGSTAAAAVRGLDPSFSSSPSPRAEPVARRSASNSSLSRQRTPEPLRFRPESPGITRSTPTPPLRRIDKRMSGDLRALRQQRSSSSISVSTPTQTQTQTPALSATHDPQVLPPPVANESRVRSKGEEKDMTDVYDGYGEGRIGSPRSPTRPHSMRRRQSMQVLELESRVDQLMAENRMLTEARTHAEQNLSSKAAGVLTERDAEIESLKQSLQFLQNEVSRLTEVNEGLTSANAELASKETGRYTDMTRELDEARGAHTTFTQSLQDKDAEIADLRAQLQEAKEQIRQMQRKILESKAGDSGFLDIKDEDYFDHRCQQLCSHVQQWVLRFSKFSDMRACRLTSEINDEKTIDRLDNSVLDGTDVDAYLRDRVKRRDIFMSMTMNMIWEFVFTRYLFGMDREQRQKLKSLEKLLTDVGPAQAVRQWRAVTLTLLSRRASFKDQRDLDTEAVVQAVFQTLCKILPPPSNLESQIQSQLRRVMHEAVELSVEMRTQRAEYMMLPPLQPEYDADGELAATVSFDAAMMNERSGHANMTNEELESQGAVVRIVLFPLVVKRGDDDGDGEDKIVVCPAQVLIARDDRGRRQYTPSEAGGASLGAPSRISLVAESMGQPDI